MESLASRQSHVPLGILSVDFPVANDRFAIRSQMRQVEIALPIPVSCNIVGIDHFRLELNL